VRPVQELGVGFAADEGAGWAVVGVGCADAKSEDTIASILEAAASTAAKSMEISG